MLKRRHQLFVVLFVIADGLMIAAASLAAWAIRIVAHDQPWPTDWESYVKDPLLLFTVPLALAVMQALRLYTPQRDRPLRAEQTQILKASVIAAACVVLFLWLAGNDLIASDARAIPDAPLGLSPARLQIAALAVALPFFVGLQRLALRLALRQLRRRGLNRRHVAIIGTGRLAQRVARTLARNSWTGLKVSYFISHHESTARTQCLDRPVVGGLDDLDRSSPATPSTPSTSPCPPRGGRRPRSARQARALHRQCPLCPRHQPQAHARAHAVRPARGHAHPLLRENPTLGLGGITKRTIDIAGALVGLCSSAPCSS
jgi:hypothetical protein